MKNVIAAQFGITACSFEIIKISAKSKCDKCNECNSAIINN
jgi:hypothetical protein